MGISFAPLLEILEKRGLRIGYLRDAVGLSGMTVAKVKKGEPITFEVLDKICRVMELRVDQVIRFEDAPFKKGKARNKKPEPKEAIGRMPTRKGKGRKP